MKKMHKTGSLKANPKLLVLLVVAVLIAIAAIFVSIPVGGSENPLSQALEGGEYALTGVGRGYESFTCFTEANEEQAGELLKAARVSVENARAKLTSAGHTEDEYVLHMVENYQTLVHASEVMAQGTENLLAIGDNLTRALDDYGRGEYEEASQEASYCLQTLTPLLSDFKMRNESLNGLNYQYIASGHRDEVDHATSQYRSEMKTYMQYILLLRSLVEGVEYLKVRQHMEEAMRQLQSAISAGQYDAARRLLQEIFSLLESLKDPNYQSVAAGASQLEPSLLSGSASRAAQELKMRLKPLEGIEALENYFKTVEEYLEALEHFEQGDLAKAEQAAERGLQGLGQGSGQGPGDPEFQKLIAGLREAFSSLLMRIRGQPEQG